MISLYICDKCGKVFTDYDECYNHEYTHWNLERWTDEDNRLDLCTEYKEGQEEPNMIHMKFRRWNQEKCEYEYRYGKFKLISSYEAPLVIENE